MLGLNAFMLRATVYMHETRGIAIGRMKFIFEKVMEVRNVAREALKI